MTDVGSLLAHGPAAEASGLPWRIHPEILALVALTAAAYAWALRRLGPRHAAPGEPPATSGQRWAFGLGIASLLVALEGPVHDAAEGYWYSAHMVQHLLLTFAAAPLLLMGTPAWLFRLLLRPPSLLRAVRFLSRPLIALALFNGVIVASHWPSLVNASLDALPVHVALHLAMIGAALVMWMPVLSPILEIPRLSYPGQMFYLFLQSLVPTVPASFLTFGDHVLYSFYETAPRLYGVSAMTDQRAAGLIMKIIGGLILWVVIAVLFFRWFAVEQRDGVDVLQNRDLDHALNRVDLTKR